MREIIDKRISMEGKSRICMICADDLPINNFQYHRPRNCFSKTCKSCANKYRRERRGKYPKIVTPPDFRKCPVCDTILPKEDFYIRKNGLISSKCKSCNNDYRKLIRKEPDKKSKGKFKNLSLIDKAKYIIYSYKNWDGKKGYENDLTIDYVIRNLQLPCTYCGYPPSGLDRIDNKLGHTQNNCVPACKECNIARMDNFTMDEMIIIGGAIKQVKDLR